MPTNAGFPAWQWAKITIFGAVHGDAGEPSGKRLPAGAFHVRNDSGGHGYAGAAPPKGDRPHRYLFAVHALDVDRIEDVDEDTSPAKVSLKAGFHTIARAVLTPTYQN